MRAGSGENVGRDEVECLVESDGSGYGEKHAVIRVVMGAETRAAMGAEMHAEMRVETHARRHVENLRVLAFSLIVVW